MSHYSGIYTIYWTRRIYYIFLVRYNGREQLDAMEIRWKPYRECPFLLTVGAGRFVKFGRNIWVKIRPSCMYIHVSGSDIWVIQMPKRLCCLCTLRHYAQPSIHKFLKLHHEICTCVQGTVSANRYSILTPPPRLSLSELMSLSIHMPYFPFYFSFEIIIFTFSSLRPLKISHFI